jgi:hypothetical protein
MSVTQAQTMRPQTGLQALSFRETIFLASSLVSQAVKLFHFLSSWRRTLSVDIRYWSCY